MEKSPQVRGFCLKLIAKIPCPNGDVVPAFWLKLVS